MTPRQPPTGSRRRSGEPDPHPASAELASLGCVAAGAALARGELRSEELVEVLRARIAALDAAGPCLRSVLALDPRASETARESDAARRSGRVRSALEGLPVLVKDNLDSAGELPTTAGSLALEGGCAGRDATAVARCRRAGAVVLGKANLSEWANFRSRRSSSGWSACGGQTRNPHVLDRSPGGSSSGSAVAVAAGLVPLAVGTETDGSILCPAALCGVVGMKPTVGVVSRRGVIPISHTQDSVGVFARSVVDASLLLRVLAGGTGPEGAGEPEGAADPATLERPQRFSLPPPDELARAELKGVRLLPLGPPASGQHPGADRLVEEVLRSAAGAGATVLDPVPVPHAEELVAGDDELTVLLCEFRAGIDDYLAERARRTGIGPRRLAELVEWNEAHADAELALFGQDLFLDALATGGLDDPAYAPALERSLRRSREEGIDALLARGADLLVAPTMGPAWLIDHVNGDAFIGSGYQLSACAGAPAISLPAGVVHGLPVGVCLMGRRFDDGLVLRVAAALERLLPPPPRPFFLPSLGLLA